MKFIIDIIKGIFVGVANVIPGVSGGTMAVSFGIYDKLLSAISNIIKDFKNSVKTLFPIAIGMVIGIISFTFIIPLLLKNQPFITSAAFTGLILGGVPMMFATLKDGWKNDTKKSLPACVIVFIIFTAIALIFSFASGNEDNGVLLNANPSTMVTVFFMGVIAAATMVIPGVSGSLVLMILGYYFGILSSVKNFITALKDLNFAALWDEFLILCPFGIGCIIGLIFISKIIHWFLKHFPSATYCGILGLIITSPVSIFYKVQQEYDMSGTSVPQILLGIVFLVACMALTLFIGKLDQKQEAEKEVKEA
ncbi:MAG: DUF368 domain-containing protein [Lachnospiraceae bacterium]|nr:DUF368 domain-containing protein [Lachnospiraceae bacterium]